MRKRCSLKSQEQSFHALGASGLYGLSSVSFSMSPAVSVWWPPVWIKQLRQVALYSSKAPAPPLLQLTAEKFLSQNVLLYQGTKISRLAVLKYVAYIAGGVHSGHPESSTDQILHRIQQIAALRPKKNGPGAEIVVSPSTLNSDMPELQDVDRYGVDFVFLQLMSAAKYLVESPDVIELEQIIRAER